jgi:hypothetical protein
MTELSSVRGLFFSLLDKRLDIESAADTLARWSDKVQSKPELEWYHRTEASRELYRLLTYRMLCAAVSAADDTVPAADLAYDLDITVDAAEEATL